LSTRAKEREERSEKSGGTVVEGKRRNGKLIGFLRDSEGMKEEIR